MAFRIVALITVLLILGGCPLDGDDGTNGVTGQAGKDGINGKDGVDGIDGVDGVDGKDGKDGKDGLVGQAGRDGADGQDGADGLNGIHCWDINQNHINDPAEDVNGDGVYNVLDCAPNTVMAQSQDALLNHQHFCEAFANLGEYPEGCPSNTHTTPAGTLTLISETTLLDDGNNGYYSCNVPNGNGLLSLEYRALDGQAWWVLKGGFVADASVMSRNDVVLNGMCGSNCDSDPKCIASFAKNQTSEAMVCYKLYHSDTVEKFEQLCGVDIGNTPAKDFCTAGLGSVMEWYSRCP